MFCKNCGTQLEEGKNFCPNCGAAIESAPEAEPVVEPAAQPEVETIAPQPVYQETQTYTIPKGDAPDQGSVMSKGIVAAALCAWPVTSIVAIVLGNIAMKHATGRREEGYRYSGKLKAGYITGKVGKIVGIVMTIFWALYFILIGVIVGSFASGFVF